MEKTQTDCRCVSRKSREYAERGVIMDITDEGFEIIRQCVHEEESKLEK